MRSGNKTGTLKRRREEKSDEQKRDVGPGQNLNTLFGQAADNHKPTRSKTGKRHRHNKPLPKLPEGVSSSAVHHLANGLPKRKGVAADEQAQEGVIPPSSPTPKT